mmetsp:Transcript_13261/g.21024  ORF Transcript_13261/g.21024 Transcript_13261/m.21024 type:complete len:80 (-) Transcript_13261:32-271(-)
MEPAELKHRLRWGVLRWICTPRRSWSKRERTLSKPPGCFLCRGAKTLSDDDRFRCDLLCDRWLTRDRASSSIQPGFEFP